MPKRPSKLPADPNRRAFAILQEAIGVAPPESNKEGKSKNPAAVALGKLGGKKGGKALAASLTKKQRSDAARKAARARWRAS